MHSCTGWFVGSLCQCVSKIVQKTLLVRSPLFGSMLSPMLIDSDVILALVEKLGMEQAHAEQAPRAEGEEVWVEG